MGKAAEPGVTGKGAWSAELLAVMESLAFFIRRQRLVEPMAVVVAGTADTALEESSYAGPQLWAAIE